MHTGDCRCVVPPEATAASLEQKSETVPCSGLFSGGPVRAPCLLSIYTAAMNEGCARPISILC
eukprot:COSAG05_NODE_1276_length_5305_cov_7.675759_10_plen_63_part_00